MRINAIIQARMSSKRLPGKVLIPIKGKPLLLYVIERVSFVDEIDQLIVSTSTNQSDDPIIDFCI